MNADCMNAIECDKEDKLMNEMKKTPKFNKEAVQGVIAHEFHKEVVSS